MKTCLFCFGLLILALFVGKQQQTRIQAAERRLASSHATGRMTSPLRERDEPGAVYHRKYTRQANSLTATEVYQTIVSWRKKRSASANAGFGAVLDNKEAFQSILQLNLAGQEELIQIIGHSSDSLFDESLVKCEQIILCILAMADKNPATALDYVRHSKEKIGMFYADRMWAKPQIQYAVRRYCDRDPQAGLDALVEIATQDPELLDSNGAAEVMATVALHEPELVLEAIQKLPAAQRSESWRAVISQVETMEECTRYFKILRTPNRNDPAAIKSILTSLGENISSREMPWKQQIEWLESLDLSDSEKRSAAQSLTTMGWEFGKDAEYASWLVEFMPVSTERNYLVWRATIGFWTASDPESAGAFLTQQGIDPEEMIKLDREGYLRK